MMQIDISDAEGQLRDLVGRAEAGEEIVLIRHGVPVARLAPIHAVANADRRGAALLAARGTMASGDPAARSQDFLYDGAGLPT